MSITEADVTFRLIKSKELPLFFSYIKETQPEEFGAMGVSLSSINKIFRINRFLFDIPRKIFYKSMNFFVLEYNNEMVAGYSLSYNKVKDEYLLGNLFVKPGLQGKGIGNILLKNLIDDHINSTIRLSVNSNNAVAIHLYEKFGFVKHHREQLYISDVPFITKPIPEGYTIRLGKKSDLANLGSLIRNFPEVDNIKKKLKNSLNKSKKSPTRIQYKLAVVIEKDNEIIGLGRAIWTKINIKNADIIARAVLINNKEVYPCLISFLTQKISDYGIEKFAWERNEYTEPFFSELVPFLGKPFQEGFLMKKKAGNHFK